MKQDGAFIVVPPQRMNQRRAELECRARHELSIGRAFRDDDGAAKAVDAGFHGAGRDGRQAGVQQGDGNSR